MQAATHTGAGKRTALPLLLLPGTLCDERLFAPLLERLPGLRTQVIETPEALSLEQAAAAVLAAAPPHFALLGYSLGGMVAVEAALQAPDRVVALALLSTTPLPVPPEFHATRRAAVAEARQRGLPSVLRERLWPGYLGHHHIPASLALVEAMAVSLGPEVFARQTEMALARTDFRPRLYAITCPTLVLAGEQDRVCPPAAQYALAEALPCSQLVLLPCAGHLAPLEQPDEVASAVAAWFHTSQPSLTSS